MRVPVSIASPPLFVLALTAAGLSLAFWPWPLASLLFGGALAGFLLWRRDGLSLLGFIALLLWCGFQVGHHRALILPESLAGQDLTVVGRIVDLPETQGAGVRFFLEPLGPPPGVAGAFPKRLRLSWYDAPLPPKGGETWRFTVRLKPPRGMLDPGQFDYEAWLFRHGIGATGYVRESAPPERLAPAGRFSVDGLRQEVLDRLRAALPEQASAGLLAGLIIGYRGDIAPPQWQTLIDTGTNHLLAISGLHVGMVAGLGFLLGRGLWRGGVRLRAQAARPVLSDRQAGAWLALLFGWAYALLAGFSVPTQRTALMLGVGLSGLLLRREWPISRLLGWAAVLVILIDPLAVLDVGFWLSFGAVALILYVSGNRLRPPDRQIPGWQVAVRLQLALSLGLLPLTALLFLRGSLVSPLANLFAVPWVTFLVTPMALLGAALLFVLPTAGSDLLLFCAFLLDGLMGLLQFLSEGPHARLFFSTPSPWAWPLAALGTLWLLAPAGVPARAYALALWLPLFWPTTQPLPAGEARIEVLDVGQGLSIIVRTQNHTLLYDAGPRANRGFDAGERIVLPALRARGITRLDTLVLSNGDADHAGGAPALLAALPVQRLLSGEIERLPALPAPSPRPEACERGAFWVWDGVRFLVLHPDGQAEASSNDRSCVLRIQAGNGEALLLTGDIERRAEARLVASQSEAHPLRADWLLVPHHGSRSSSTPPFLDAVQARHALGSVGYRNRFGHPHAQVLARYDEAGVPVYLTRDCGTLRFTLGEPRMTGEETVPACPRRDGPRWPWRSGR